MDLEKTRQNHDPHTSTRNENMDQSQGEKTETGSNIQSQISLPKGGGAIKGIGEKFDINYFTGTASLTVPIYTTPSRSDFYPKLSLSYDSAGKGNGIFGMGWNISIPSITRKTEKGLPRYLDSQNSDTFILSGSEDLVPTTKPGSSEKLCEETFDGEDYVVQYYRPRIEGLFSLIKKCENKNTLAVHWRSISKDNITTIYGKSTTCQIADPNNQSHIFSWLIEESHDDKGNVISYEYKEEDGSNVTNSIFENNRLQNKDFTNQYIKRIKYGNQKPFEKKNWLFEIVFDYCEHDINNNPYDETVKWIPRPDPFSSYRSRFEIRTYRLCKSIMIFHNFDELETVPYLVHSTDLKYFPDGPNLPNHVSSFLQSITQTGYAWKKKDDGTYGYNPKSLPSLEFDYMRLNQDIQVQEVDSQSLENVPIGIDGNSYRFVDLESEGISGILSQQDGAWFYKHNLGDAHFGPMQQVALIPSLGMRKGKQQITDLEDDGQKYLVQYGGTLSGYYKLQDDYKWESFRPFKSIPNIDWNDPNLKFVDIDGDGHPDILISQLNVFVWYHSKGREGFGSWMSEPKTDDEDKGPALVFADPMQSIYLADMSGDGLTDILRIRNGEVCYWPNLGYGKFGNKITMYNSPIFDETDQFDNSRIRLADIDGSGTTDILYLGRNGIKFWFNQSGNSFSEKNGIESLPSIDNLSSVMVLDLFGNGTSCIVWSSPLPENAGRQMQYIDLMESTKPYLLYSIKNNMGSETQIGYAVSTKFHLEDLKAGKPWITKLPFPVHVVERIQTNDYLSNTKLVSTLKYHHGYYDRHEREFRGFGLVEHWDTESFDQFSKPTATPANYDVIEKELYVPPVHTKTWYHTGTYHNWKSVSKHLAEEYYAGDSQAPGLADSSMTSDMGSADRREAYRSLKGMVLREEVYADDGTLQSQDPYAVTEHRYSVNLLQPIRDESRHAIFSTYEEEVVGCHYERNSADPRIEHNFVFQVDDYGNVQSKATVYYPRRNPKSTSSSAPSWSSETFSNQFSDVKATLTITDYSMIVNQNYVWITGVPYQTRSYELGGINVANGMILEFADICNQIFGMASIPDSTTTVLPKNVIDYGIDFTRGIQARLYAWKRSYFWDPQNNNVLSLGNITTPLLPHYSEDAVAPAKYIAAKLAFVTDTIMKNEGGYVSDSGYWWNQRMRKYYLPSNNFFLQYVTVDPFGNFDPNTSVGQHYYIVTYDKYFLATISSTDPLQNKTQAVIDYRTLKPQKLTDINNNISQVVFDELGMVTAFTIFGQVNGVPSGDGDLTNYNMPTNVSVSDIIQNQEKYLQGATAYFYYDYDAWINEGNPPLVLTVHRNVHQKDLPAGQLPSYQFSILYSDGLGRQLQKKVKADPEPVLQKHPDGSYKKQPSKERWLTSGKTVFNNKGKPVKQYEPFYSATSDYEFEDALIEFGVTPIIHYDPLQRVIRIDTPKGFFSKVVFNPWNEEYWDENDTIKDSKFYGDIQNVINNNTPSDWTHSKWSAERLNAEWQAVKLSIQDYATPTVKHFNCMGQEFMHIDLLIDNQTLASGPLPKELYTKYELDINGNKLSITDPRQYVKNQTRTSSQIVKNFQFSYDIQNRKLVSIGTDNGTEMTLQNIFNKTIYIWNANGYLINTKYDALQRPTTVYVTGNGLNNLVEQIQYGESPPASFANPALCNLRGQPVLHKDQAGLKEFLCYDIEQHNIQFRTTLRVDYKDEVDWTSSNSTNTLDTEQFSSAITFDALNRVVTRNQSDGSIQQYVYDQTGKLYSISVQLDKTSSPKSYVNSIQYNAKGQREKIDYDNGITTTYVYERETFRLISLTTTRDDGKILQDLSYVYDPVGNITWLQDNNQNVIFYNQTMIQPLSTYTYDSLYRLVQANGRQNFGIKHDDYMNADAFKQSRYCALDDSKALANYGETYQYDESGNLTQLKHNVDNSSSECWTRTNTYFDCSNRLKASSVGSDIPIAYQYDNAGNMTTLENLQNPINWNYRNNIASVTLIPRKGDNSDAEYYVYGSDGMRVRKVLERNLVISGVPSLQTEEKIYLDGYEIKRVKTKSLSSTDLLSNLVLERFSIHVMDDKTRVALVHKWTLDIYDRETDGVPVGGEPVIKYHYQLNNHLGSSILELDETGDVIRYEDYFPFGGTSLIAGKSVIEVSIKDYRYTGKECDDSTSLYYFGARYYIPWLTRWINCDPEGIIDGTNVYCYVHDNPVLFVDHTGNQADGYLGDNIHIPVNNHHTKVTNSTKETRKKSDGGGDLNKEQKQLSGKDWKNKYPSNNTLEALENKDNKGFGSSVKNFVQALQKAGVKVSINSVYRPVERQYLMYHAKQIATGKEKDPNKVPERKGVNIQWDHGDLKASVKAAQEMVDAFGIKNTIVAPPNTSEHNKGYGKTTAIDMTLSWNTMINVQFGPNGPHAGETVPIGPLGKKNLNPIIMDMAKSYGVTHFGDILGGNPAKDPPHWSIDGR